MNTGIIVRGHSLMKMNPKHPYRWECRCGAHGNILAGPSAGSRERGRRIEHDEHKINVLRSQRKLNDEGG